MALREGAASSMRGRERLTRSSVSCERLLSLLRRETASGVAVQERDVAKLADARPAPAGAPKRFVDLEIRDERPPAIGGNFLFEHLQAIGVEPVVAQREMIVVVLARAAELHRDHERVRWQLSARPSNRFG